MSTSELIRQELKDIAAIVSREACSESIRRGCPVSTHDPVVQQLAARVILGGAGRELHERYAARKARMLRYA